MQTTSHAVPDFPLYAHELCLNMEDQDASMFSTELLRMLCVVPVLHYEEPTVNTDDISAVKSYTASGQQQLVSAVRVNAKRARNGLCGSYLPIKTICFR